MRRLRIPVILLASYCTLVFASSDNKDDPFASSYSSDQTTVHPVGAAFVGLLQGSTAHHYGEKIRKELLDEETFVDRLAKDASPELQTFRKAVYERDKAYRLMTPAMRDKALEETQGRLFWNSLGSLGVYGALGGVQRDADEIKSLAAARTVAAAERRAAIRAAQEKVNLAKNAIYRQVRGGALLKIGGKVLRGADLVLEIGLIFDAVDKVAEAFAQSYNEHPSTYYTPVRGPVVDRIYRHFYPGPSATNGGDAHQ